MALAVCLLAAPVVGSADRNKDHDVIAALDARLAAIEKTELLLKDQNDTRSDEQRKRVRAAYKLARSGWSRLWVAPDSRLDLLRWRSASRRILLRDVQELSLLRDEIGATAAARNQLLLDRVAAEHIERPEARSLRPPVIGPVVAPFGDYRERRTGTLLTRRGVELHCRRGIDVQAVARGQVRYAGALRGLGQVVVTDHGRYHSVVGKLSHVDVASGQNIEQGQSVGAAAGDRVYLEIRLSTGSGGHPVDPEPLLASRAR